MLPQPETRGGMRGGKRGKEARAQSSEEGEHAPASWNRGEEAAQRRDPAMARTIHPPSLPPKPISNLRVEFLSCEELSGTSPPIDNRLSGS